MKKVFLTCLIIMLSVSFVVVRSYGQNFKENPPRLIDSPGLSYGTIAAKPVSVTFIAFFTDDDDILTEANRAPYSYDSDTGIWSFEEGNFWAPPGIGETGYIWLYGSNGICYHDSDIVTGSTVDWGETPVSGSDIEPPNLTATPGSPGTIRLNWTAASGATKYTLYRSVTSNGAYETRVAENITDTTYVDTGLEHQDYYYIVVGKDDSDNYGGHSNEASADVLLYGDVSADGNITAYDASLVLQYVVGLIELSLDAQDAADVTGNNTVTALDAALILQYCVGLITEFPIE
jgi:hypothetical protein